jgi:hypothetical protein
VNNDVFACIFGVVAGTGLVMMLGMNPGLGLFVGGVVGLIYLGKMK